ncbi:chaperonin 10-like protein [Aspergillus ambiguus]|uniref:zinc-binding alcohol dehydrogenase family protein n=1 Tax=Aspergillus ambiguus TaxID=176160 RepID=UPI003CCE53EF
METNKAAIIKQAHAPVVVESVETWVPGPGQVLVRNEAISFNPIESKIQKWDMLNDTYPAISGFTFAGVVLQVGPEVTSVQPGDRVAVARWGWTGGDKKFGAFQKFSLALEQNLVRLEPHVSFQNAAGVIANLSTVVAALSICMGLDFPPVTGKAKNNGRRVFVYGGSSSVGALAVQYASDAGYEVVTTSSPQNWEMVQARGPSVIIDHTQTEDKLLTDIHAHEPYAGIFDAIGSPEVTRLMGQLLAENGGLFFSTSPTPVDGQLPKNVEKRWFGYSEVLVSDPQNEKARKWYLGEYLPVGLSSGSIYSNPALQLSGGLGTVQETLDLLFDGKVSGKKVFINPQV